LTIPIEQNSQFKRRRVLEASRGRGSGDAGDESNSQSSSSAAPRLSLSTMSRASSSFSMFEEQIDQSDQSQPLSEVMVRGQNQVVRQMCQNDENLQLCHKQFIIDRLRKTEQQRDQARVQVKQLKNA